MKSCNDCKYLGTSLISKFIYKCLKKDKSKRFNHPELHGWICEDYESEEEYKEKDDKDLKEKR